MAKTAVARIAGPSAAKRYKRITKGFNNETDSILFAGRVGSICRCGKQRGCCLTQASSESSLPWRDMEDRNASSASTLCAGDGRGSSYTSRRLEKLEQRGQLVLPHA